MKKILLRSLLLLLVAVMSFQMVACGGGGGEGGETTTPAGGETTPPVDGGETTLPPVAEEYIADLVINGKSEYVLIYPTGTDKAGDLYKGLIYLSTWLNNQLGAKMDFKTDDTEVTEKEILVGHTNRPESAAALEGLKIGEGVYQVVENKKLVINGTDEKAVYDIMKLFVDNIVKAASNKSLSLSSYNNHKNTKQYDLESITIDGVDIGEFKIVVAEDNSLETNMAKLFQRYIAVNNGHVLDVVNDDTEAGAHEIRFGVTNRTVTQVSENQYAVTVKDGHMEIVFSGMFGVDAINSVLMNDYFNRTYWKPEYRAMDDGQTLFIAKKEVVYIGQDLTDKTDVTMPMVQTYEPADQFVEKATGSNYRIMFHNVWGATNEYCGARAQLIIAVYETYQPDVIGLQEASSYWNTTGGKEAVETWLLENGYSEIRYDQGTARPIFYKTDKFTLTKSGALRTPTGYGVTWAVFKDKATGKTFGVTNTHMTADSVTDDDHDKGTMARVTDAETVLEAIKEIHKVSKNCAVISGGDYNAAYGDIYIDDEGTEFDAMATLTDGGATNVRDLVVEDGYCTPYGGMSGGGDYYEAYGVYSFKTWTGGKPENAVDHILYAGGENNATIHQYVLLTDVVSASASDHVPHFVDISVK